MLFRSRSSGGGPAHRARPSAVAARGSGRPSTSTAGGPSAGAARVAPTARLGCQVRRTNATKVRSELPTVPVTSQQPSVGNETPLAWKPWDPYPSGTEERSGGPGASSRRPVMVSVPETIRHQPNFHPIDPSLSTNPESASITPPSPRPPTHRASLPNAADDPKSRSPMSTGALPGFVTGQLFASATVSGEAVSAGVPVAATVEERDGGLGGGGGEQAANAMLRSRRTAEVLMSKPRQGRIVSSSLDHTPTPLARFPATALACQRPTLRGLRAFTSTPRPRRSCAATPSSQRATGPAAPGRDGEDVAVAHEIESAGENWPLLSRGLFRQEEGYRAHVRAVRSSHPLTGAARSGPCTIRSPRRNEYQLSLRWIDQGVSGRRRPQMPMRSFTADRPG